MHEHWQLLLPEYISDELPEMQRKALEEHLETCSECRQALDEWRVIVKVSNKEAESHSQALPALKVIADLNGKLDSPVSKMQLIKEATTMTSLRVPQQKSYSIPWSAAAVLILTFFFSLMLLGGLDLQPVPLPLQQGQGLGDIPEDPIELFQLYIDEVWNKQNMDAIPQLLSENHVHHDASMSESRLLFGIETTENYITSDTMIGHDAFAEYVAFEHDILPDVTFTTEGLVTNGDTISGRVKMAYEAFEATVPVSATITDGKLTETWFDVGTMTEVYNTDLINNVINLWFSKDNQEGFDLLPFYNSPYTDHFPLGTWSGNTTAQEAANWIRLHYNNSCKDMKGETVTIARGNLVLVQRNFTCNFAESFAWGITIQPTNEIIDGEAVYGSRIQDGKVVEGWWYTDDPRFWAVAAKMLSTGSAKSYDGLKQMEAIYNENSPIVQAEALAELYVNEIWNTEKIDETVFDELYIPDIFFGYQQVMEAGSTRTSRTEFAALHSAIKQAFPDANMEVLKVFADANDIAIQFTWTGTHTAIFEYQDIMLSSSNDVVSVNGTIILASLTQGKVIRETWYADFPFLADFEQIAEG